MKVIDKIRVKRKIHRLCVLLQKRMNKQDVMECVRNIKDSLRLLPQERKEGLLDVCLKVLR